ncbi:helix-turn-helix domain-containing protein [Desulfotignum phosphitoxidans]|uniref:Uncharacterized protein n=1 Tax=Desulfotignum phosphitoxidans DSM 13687 TaxID=1286635 RepID=S0G3A4_9BACT|nr:helix-turn-helix domain-containing protein [Desulfotignum phosphitoxidans]EMS78662.1 hypothetical protein Dpo_7c01380 [Desulfotignum phosphitoxidans DSM 13687]
MGRDIKLLRMHGLGMSQDRMAKRLGLDQKTILQHLGKMPILANSLNTDLSRGFTVAQVAEKQGWQVLSPWVGAVMAGSNTLKQDNNNVEKL